MTGKLYGLGVGPGDPELLTVKALRLVKESDVVAVPGAVAEESVAYKIVKGVYQELDEKKEGYEEICRHTLSILIAQLRRITDSGFQLVPSFHPSKECAQVKRYLDSNYGEDINLDQLAALSHLNKYYLSHEFTRYYGISPINYLNRRRIEVCKNLLENTDHDISDIAHLAGFSSQSYLAQSFRKSCGMTAMEYRRSRRE